MTTKHYTYIGMAQQMTEIKDNSVDLIITSPPYPMIEMWDQILGNQNVEITKALEENDGMRAFELMHRELDYVWQESFRVLKEGGIICINIGDATRTINGNFALYSNHARILNSLVNLGFVNLPNIIWRKQTNAPNKFMGSGMLPCGAYVTLEHEWILVFRKGEKRAFKSLQEKELRRESAYFWEERNSWFSDLWDLKGVKQKISFSTTRDRSAAYPLIIPYRLINMYSVKGDVVLDPFIGTGTTTVAAILSERNSIGYDIDNEFQEIIDRRINSLNISDLNRMIDERIQSHLEFAEERKKNPEKTFKHYNSDLEINVVTSQETGLNLSYIDDIEKDSDFFKVSYTPIQGKKIEKISCKSTKGSGPNIFRELYP